EPVGHQLAILRCSLRRRRIAFSVHTEIEIRTTWWLLGALIGGSLSFSALGQSITDGDSLEINGTRWRLHAIDAPELYQTCPDGWPAGAEAAAYLRSLIAGRTLTCEPRGTDRYGRTIGLCRADG